MKEPPKEPKKIKIVVKPSGPVIKKVNIKEEQIDKQPQKPVKKKSILRRIGEIVSNDIRHLPDKLWGERKSVNMPESNESWKDWEDQI